MKKIFTLVLILCSFLSFSQSTTLVISQVYGGGGNAGAPFNADFVELHNISTTAQSTAGLSIQYASSGATGAWTGIVVLPTASIPAGGYYLVRMSVASTTVGAALPTPDANPVTGAEVAMSSTNGRVALVNGTTAITACPTSVIDLVGFGSSVCFEGSAATGVLSNSTAALRKVNGCTDTNNNGADFTVDAPAPRNSASPAVSCSGAPSPSLIVTGTVTGFGNVTVGATSASQTFNLSGSNLTGFPGVITITAPSTDFEVSTDNTTFTASVTVAFTSATLASTPIYVRFSPQSAGLKAGNLSIAGGGQSPALTVALNGTGVAAAGATLATTGTINDFGNVVILTNSTSQTFSLSGTNLTGAPGNITVTAPSADFLVSTNNTTFTPSVTIPYTTATLAATPVYIRFVPQTVGVKSGNISISGGGATTITIAVSGTGVNAAPPSGSQVRISQVYGGGGNAAGTGTPPTPAGTYNQDFVELFNSGTSAVDISGWSVQYAAYNGPSGTNNWTGAIIPAGTSIGAGKYYLISFATISTTNGIALPTPDLVGPTTTNLSGTSGKVALVNNSTFLTGTTACSNAAVVDVLGFSTTSNIATCFEGTTFTSTGIDNSKSMFRKNNGCTDTDNNSADFEVLTVSPRNSASAANNCGTPAVPALTTAGTVNDFGNIVVGTNSTSQSFTLSGTNLTGAPGVITVTAPSTAGFEVSNDNATWSLTTTIPYTTATLAATPVYIRFSPTALGPISASIGINGGGASVTFGLVSGTGVSATAPNVTATSLLGFGNICTGTTNGTNSFVINGTNLTNANVTVAALAGFTYSTAAAGPFTTTLSLTQPGGTYSQEIFVQFSPVAVQSYDGNIVIAGGGLTTSVNVPATGAGVNTTATVATGAASGVTINSATAAGTISANGCSAVTAYGIEYSTTNNFPTGTGTKVVSTNIAAGAFTSALSGLTGATVYYYRAYATNGGGTAYGAQMTFTTLAPPPAVLVAGPLTAFGSVCIPGSGGPNSVNLGGANLTTANVVVGPLAGYSFATTAAGTFTPTLTLTQPGGTFAQTFYVKFTPTATQAYNGNIPVSGGGATAINIAASGSGVSTPPAATTVDASATTTTSAQLNGTVASIGCSAVTYYGFEYSPIDGFANGQGTLISASNLNGGNFSIVANGLVPGATYYYKAFAQSPNGRTYGVQKTFTVKAVGNGLIVYSTPVLRGGRLRFSLNPIKPGHYAAALYNMAGQKVFKKEMLVQVGFVNDSFILPNSIPSGVYIFQIENYEFKIRKQIIIK